MYCVWTDQVDLKDTVSVRRLTLDSRRPMSSSLARRGPWGSVRPGDRPRRKVATNLGGPYRLRGPGVTGKGDVPCGPDGTGPEERGAVLPGPGGLNRPGDKVRGPSRCRYSPDIIPRWIRVRGRNFCGRVPVGGPNRRRDDDGKWSVPYGSSCLRHRSRPWVELGVEVGN